MNPLSGCICTVGHQSADQQLMAVLSSNMKGGIAIFIHTVNLSTWGGKQSNRMRQMSREPVGQESLKAASQVSQRGCHGYRFG